MAKRNNNTAVVAVEVEVPALCTVVDTAESVTPEPVMDLASLLSSIETTAGEAENFTLSEEELAAIAAQAAAAEAQAEAQALDEALAKVAAEVQAIEETEKRLAPAVTVEGDFQEIVSALDPEVVEKSLEAIKGSFAKRKADEITKNPSNQSIQDTLKGYEQRLCRSTIAAMLVATNVTPSFVSENGYAVYAIDKVADIMNTLAGAAMKNAVTLAIMRSMFKFRAAGVEFTGDMALAAASDKIKVTAAMQALLVRHTLKESIAPTQRSTTMKALMTAGVVVNRGSSKNPSYQLTDTPQTRALQAAIAA